MIIDAICTSISLNRWHFQASIRIAISGGISGPFYFTINIVRIESGIVSNYLVVAVNANGQHIYAAKGCVFCLLGFPGFARGVDRKCEIVVHIKGMPIEVTDARSETLARHHLANRAIKTRRCFRSSTNHARASGSCRIASSRLVSRNDNPSANSVFSGSKV